MKLSLLVRCVFYITVSLVIVPQSLAISPKELRAKEQAILDSLLGASYDNRIRPSGVNETDTESGPVVVTINMFVRQLDELSTDNMELKSQLTFRQQWRDSRLAFNDESISYLGMRDDSLIWTPDVFFTGSRSGFRHEMLHPNTLIRIYPTGDILYSTRISLTTACPMDVKYFPHDAQVCSIRIATYSYTTDDLIFQWKSIDPVQVTMNLPMKEFTLAKFMAEYASSKTNTGEYSSVIAKFFFQREFAHYWVSVYIPCFFFVLLAYLSLWIEKEDQRFILSLTATTALSFLVMYVSDTFPAVSYTKAVDIWTGTCLTFTAGSLLLVVLINRLPRASVRKESHSVEEGDDLLGSKQTSDAGQSAIPQITRSLVERVARVGYPLLFLIFALTYWLSQARRSSYD